MTDPRIEAAAKAIEAVTYSDVTGTLAEECATAALAAADKAATVTIDWGVRYSDSGYVSRHMSEGSARETADTHNAHDKTNWGQSFDMQVVSRTVTEWKETPMTTPPLDLPAERITALRDIANAATDGPWESADDDGWIGGPRCFIVSSDEDSINDAGRPIKVAYRSPGDARHIAAFDPPTVLTLLDRLEAAERDLAAVTVSRDGWQTRAEAAEAESKVLRSAVETSNDAWAALTTRADNLESS